MKYLITINDFFKRIYVYVTTIPSRFIESHINKYLDTNKTAFGYNKTFWSKIFANSDSTNTLSTICSWTVPKGETLYIKSLTFSIGRNNANKPIRFSILTSYKNEPFMPRIELQLMENFIQQYLDIPLNLKEDTNVKVTVIGETSGVHGLLVGYITL